MSRTRPTVREIYFDRAEGTTLERELQSAAFFARVRLRNGVTKATYDRRLDDLNDLVLGLLPRESPLELMDVAVSSGVSTLEWSESLDAAGIAHRLVAGDSSVHAWLVSVGCQWETLCDREGFPLHFDVLGRGIPNAASSIVLSIVILLLRAGFWAVLRLQPTLRRSLVSADGQYRSSWVSSRPVTLVSPRLDTHRALTVVEDDIIEGRDASLRRRFHAVRAANILNRAYFDRPVLVRIAENLRERLRDRGLLIVCRTSRDGSNNGSVFQLNPERRFEIVARIGEGSEVEDVVLGV